MASRIAVLLAVGVVAAGCSKAGQKEAAQASANEAPTDSTAAARAALDKLAADYTAAYNAHDAAAIAAMFTDSCFAFWADGNMSFGPAAVQARMQQELAASPTLSLQSADEMIFGDDAAGHGTYTITMPAAKAGASPTSFSGTYMTAFRRVNGTWKIQGVLTNFGGAPPPGMKLAPDTALAPPEHGTMTDLTTAWMKAFDGADWPALAQLYTTDAFASYSGTPDIQGRDSLQAAYANAFGTKVKPHIELHDVGTHQLSPDYAFNGGWYKLTGTTPQGKIQQQGIFFNLDQKQPDGSWKIRWDVSNGVPKPAT